MNAITLWNQNPAAIQGIEISTETKWAIIRRHRVELLTQSDWTQLPDAVLTVAEKSAWQDYRQSLRDIPQDFINADDVIFQETP